MPSDSKHRPEFRDSATIRLHRLGPGLLAVAIGLLCLSGGILFWRTSDSFPQLGRVSVVAVIGASVLWAVRIAVRDICGAVVVDHHCFRLRPWICGFTLLWMDVSVWSLQGDSETKRSSVIWFWQSGNPRPRGLPVKWFAVRDRSRLVQALRHFAGEKARRF